MTDVDSPAHQQLWAIANHPAMRECYALVEAIAGFRLPAEHRAAFLRYHAYITADPPPRYIAEFRASGRRYHIHVNGVLGDTQNALACVYYHLGRIEHMESAVEDAIASSGARDIIGDSVAAVGNSLALDFEYQALILGIRRCLDYLTRALASYFKNDFHSFRRFAGFLSHATPATVGVALAEAHSRHVAHFDFVLSQAERRSTRDLISHYEFVPAGVINISKRGFVLAGGGEGLTWRAGEPPPPLRDVLRSYASHLQQCIDDLLDTFVDACRSHEANS